MDRQNLAKKLVAVNNEAARERLLKKNPDLADRELAFSLKELCLSAYSFSPAEAQRAAVSLKTLIKFDGNPETKAFGNWAAGVAAITRGQFQAAISSLERAAGIFRRIGDPHNAAQTEVAKLIPLALLGKNDEAVKTGKRALRVLEKCGDELGAGKVEMNLSNIVSRRELNREAAKYGRSALRRFTALGEKTWTAMAENDLANTYAQLNDFRKAEDYYARALRSAKAAGMSVTEAEIEASMGNLAALRGKFDRALKFLEESRQKYELLDMPHQTAIAELEIADIYLELNLVREAFSIYETVIEKLHKLKMPGEEARARANCGKACATLLETRRSRVELNRSAKLYLAEKNGAGAALVKISEAVIELTSQNFRTALKLIKAAQKLLEKSENIRHRLTLDWLSGEALRNLNRRHEAEQVLTRTLSVALRQEQKNIARTSLNSLGHLAVQNGDREMAKRYFKRAVGLVETLRQPLPAEEFRMAFLADKLAPFENLAKIYLSQKNWEEAFYYVEQSRSRALAESLDGHLAQFSKAPAGLTKKLETLREQLNWYYSRLNKTEEADTEQLQAAARSREMQIADVMRQIESVSGDGSGSSRARRGEKPGGLKALQKQLGSRKTLIEFVNFDGVISAFVVSQKSIDYIPGLADESEIIGSLEGLQFQFGALRYGSANLLKFNAELKRRADFHLQRLYQKLLKPLEENFRENDLIVVPVGVLYYVPFHALHDGEKYVVESREVVHAPGAEVWQKLDRKPVKKLKNALLFGFADERIPLVNQEIRALAKAIDRSKSFTGKRAKFALYKEAAPKFDVLHIACHGQFRPENPLFSSLRLADGNVTVRDICAQRIKAQLVTLSACETGLNKVFAGDEILGLARGFLVAGASSLVLSLWTVNDESTTELMKEFYAGILNGETVSGALRKAQCNFARRGSHPYYWSPFAVIGK